MSRADFIRNNIKCIVYSIELIDHRLSMWCTRSTVIFIAYKSAKQIPSLLRCIYELHKTAYLIIRVQLISIIWCCCTFERMGILNFRENIYVRNCTHRTNLCCTKVLFLIIKRWLHKIYSNVLCYFKCVYPIIHK